MVLNGYLIAKLNLLIPMMIFIKLIKTLVKELMIL